MNHGTAPDEVDASGQPLLVQTMVYTFSGSKDQMEALQAAYKNAVYDDASNKFLSLANGEGLLEKAFIDGIMDYMDDDAAGLVCSGSVSKEELIGLLEAGDFYAFGKALPDCNWEKSDWENAINAVLHDTIDELGDDIMDYHVCNNDADLQVRLIKNYIETGKIQMPSKEKKGIMVYFTPD